MAEKCSTFSSKPDHIRICEKDENGNCVKNCQDVPMSNLHPRIAVEFKRLQNAVAKYSK